jgi:hypothetical protein
MKEMINPHLLEAKYKRWDIGRWHRQKYLAVLVSPDYTRATRREFIRASDAHQYANRVRARWCRLYDAAILSVAAPIPAE